MKEKILGKNLMAENTEQSEKLDVRCASLDIGYRRKGGTTTVAGGIDATIRGGELTCLLGANGVGKSTLLRTLAAFQPKLGGHIYIGGREIDTYGDRELARTIGVVLTEKPDAQNMTVRELVCLGRSPYTGFWGTCSADDLAIVDEAIAMAGTGSLSGRMVSTLSDGERQKVMIAKALAQQTPVIYLDEPTAFLDFPSKVETMQLLRRISREAGKTVFLSTHDMELALQTADTVWLMDRRKGIVTGTPEDLALDGSLASFFSRRGISFDPQAGLFRVDSEITARIGITAAPGPRRDMVLKALRRNGIEAAEGHTGGVSIKVTPDTYIIYSGGKAVTAGNIGAMLRCILK